MPNSVLFAQECFVCPVLSERELDQYFKTCDYATYKELKELKDVNLNKAIL